MSDWFNARKAAQVAAFFCERQGGRIDVLKLVKLIYLADRQSILSRGFPITNDRFVAMPHGPANSLTLNYIDGNMQSAEWSELVSDRDGYQVGLARAISDNDRDELSDADESILGSIWADFGHMVKYAIRDWTHKNCPEWQDPDGSSAPISHEEVLTALGVENAAGFASEISAERNIASVLARLRA